MQKSKKSDKQKRVLGCAGWGALLAFISVFLVPFLTDLLSRPVTESFEHGLASHYFSSSFFAFMLALIPIMLLSMIIGSRTRPTIFFWKAVVIIVPLVTICFTFVIFYGYAFEHALSDTPKPRGESFWYPTGLIAIFEGLLLGFIASYGYWHAGRKKESDRFLSSDQSRFEGL